jgi:hypothetical protein
MQRCSVTLSHKRNLYHILRWRGTQPRGRPDSILRWRLYGPRGRSVDSARDRHCATAESCRPFSRSPNPAAVRFAGMMPESWFLSQSRLTAKRRSLRADRPGRNCKHGAARGLCEQRASEPAALYFLKARWTVERCKGFRSSLTKSFAGRLRQGALFFL